MQYETLYDDFVQLFPDNIHQLQELSKSASAEPSDGMHIMFGMVVVPFLMDLLEKKDTDKLAKAFAFFEKMAESGDSMISEVLEFTVLEDLISRGKDVLNQCKPYMQPKTLGCCSSVEKYMM
jgi:hypothetical protein